MPSAVLYTDGGCSPNPGPATAAGICLGKDGSILFSFVDYLGDATNNVAELTAILMGMQKAKAREITRLSIKSDSVLSVGLCNGTKQTTKPHLMSLVKDIQGTMGGFKEVHLEWVEAHSVNYWNNQVDALCTWMLQKIPTMTHTSSKEKQKEIHSAAEKLWLNCPFAEKDAVKQLGARWDAAKKQWYAELRPNATPAEIQSIREKFQKWCGVSGFGRDEE